MATRAGTALREPGRSYEFAAARIAEDRGTVAVTVAAARASRRQLLVEGREGAMGRGAGGYLRRRRGRLRLASGAGNAFGYRVVALLDEGEQLRVDGRQLR